MKAYSPPCRRPSRAGFSLVEILVSIFIMMMILLVVFGITQQTARVWKTSRSKIDAFQDARLAFATLTRALGQAMLNTHYDYFDNNNHSGETAGSTFAPSWYGPQSELHFISGKSLVSGSFAQVTHAVFFQTPAGYASDTNFQNMQKLLNACGFFIIYGQDPLYPQFFSSLPNAPKNSSRYRLIQFLQPSEQLAVYASGMGTGWFQQPLQSSSPPIQQLAVNVIAMAVLPCESATTASLSASTVSLSDNYEYDSRQSPSSTGTSTHAQLPPEVEIVLTAIDDASAQRLGGPTGTVGKMLGGGQLFQQSSQLDADIASLEAELIKERAVYRIFRTTVALHNSKWTSQ